MVESLVPIPTRVCLAVGLLAACVWIGTSTEGANPGLEQARDNFVAYDFFHYYRPNAEVLGARLAEGELPLWSPRNGLGAPFLATFQPGVLYPPNWLHAVLPKQTSFAVLAAVHLGLAGALAAALAFALGARTAGAVAAGLLYATSVRMLTNVWIPPFLYASAWIPGVLLAIEGVLRRPSSQRGTTLAATVALQILVGFPYTVAHTALAATIYSLARLVAGARAHSGSWAARRVAVLGVGALLGACVAAPLLLPAYELLAHTPRAVGSLEFAQLTPLGRSTETLGQVLLSFAGSRPLPGVVAVAFAILALVRPGIRGPSLWGLSIAGTVMLLASLPESVPVHRWISALPVYGDLRNPSRYGVVALASTSVLAGIGVSRLGELLASRRGLGRRLSWAAAAAALAGPLLATPERVLDFPRVASDLPSAFATLEAFAEHSPVGPHRVYVEGLSRRASPETELHLLSDLEPLGLLRTALLMNYLQTGMLTTARVRPEFDPSFGVEPSSRFPYTGTLELPRSAERATLLDLLSVNVVAAASPHPAWLRKRLQRSTTSPTLFANPHALPRAYRVGRVEQEPEGLEDAFARLVAEDFDPATEILVDELPPSIGLESPSEATGSVEILEYEAERVRLRTSGASPGVVVLTDAWYPGWRATVDRKPVTIRRANTAARAVAVPAGAHEVVFTYRPASFRWGVGISALACALAGAAILRQRRGADS